jgi:hypothetical protein
MSKALRLLSVSIECCSNRNALVPNNYNTYDKPLTDCVPCGDHNTA